MENQPLVSIIIPTFNRLAALGELLEAISRQSVRDFEIIVVNDAGSPVDEVVALYEELRIHVVNMKENGLHVRARNAGLEVARGEYILLCDDDDLITPNHLETMLAEMESNGVDLVYSDVEIFDYIIEENRRIPTSRFLFAYEYDPVFMRKFSTFVSSGCLYRRTIHDTIGPFDVEMHNYWDWDFILRVMDAFRVKRVPVASAMYAYAVKGGENMSANLSPTRNIYLEKLCEKHDLGELPQKNFFTLLEDPEVKKREAASKRVWDGTIVRSRFL